MTHSFLSIIITTYNEEEHIAKCLISIFKNKYKNYEIIIVDDASTDNTVKIIKKFPVKLFRLKKNFGAAFAKNLAIQKSSSKYIFFIDADATLRTNSLVKMIKIIKKNKELSGVNGIWSDVPINKGYFPKFQSVDKNYEMQNISKLKYSFHWGNGSIIEKKILTDIGGFNTNFRGAGTEDYELALRIPNDKKFIVKKNLTSIKHNFPYFFFSGIKKYISRSKGHIEVLLKLKKKDSFHANKKNLFILIFSNLTIFFFLIEFKLKFLFLIVCLFSYFLLIKEKLVFIKKKNNLTFLLYYFFTSIIINFLMTLGSTTGLVSYFIKKIIKKA